MEGDSPPTITPTEPGYYWAVPAHWEQRKDNLAIVEVRSDGLQLMVDDGGDDFSPLDEYTFYSGPLPKPEIPPPAAWYKPEAPP
jgi:hypothetical protein